GSDLAIAAQVALKFALTPARSIRWFPVVIGGLFVILRRLMAEIPQRQRLTLFDRLMGLSDENAVHRDIGTNGQIPNREFVLGRNRRDERVGGPTELNLLARFQISEYDQNVVARIELEDFCH